MPTQMITSDSPSSDDGKPSSENTSATTKTINVEVPELVYWHVRRCATESRMSMKEFMAIFCTTAAPIQSESFSLIATDNGLVDVDENKAA